MLFGKSPLEYGEEGLYLQLCPAIPEKLIPANGELMGTFLGKILVMYHIANLRELKPDAYKITGYQIQHEAGTVFISDGRVPEEWAKRIRNGNILHLDVSVEPIRER